MATTAGFKQQCPSCEAWVPIRDPNLIGRKIDCPKCKYRFVVEEPPAAAEEEGAEGEERPVEADGARGGGNGRGGTARAKRRGRGREGELGSKKAAGGLSTQMIVGIAVGAVALLILVAVGLWMFGVFGGDSSSTRTAGSSVAPARTMASNTEEKEDEDKDKDKKAAGQPSAEFITNLLPPEAEGFCDIKIKDLFTTQAGRTIFETAGAFRNEALRQRLGFSVRDIDLLVKAWNFSKNWSFTVLHSTEKINFDQVKAALHAPKQPKKIEDFDYYVLPANPWLNGVGREMFSLLLQVDPDKVPAHSGPLALRKYDDQTLVFADVAPMEEFLKAKQEPKRQSKEAETSGEEKKEEGDQGGPGGKFRQMGPMMGGGRPPGGMRGGRPMPGAGRGQTPQPDTVGPSNAYLTVRKDLKELMDRLESKKPVAAIVFDKQNAASHFPVLSHNILRLQTFLEGANLVGAALDLKEGVDLTVAADFAIEDPARKAYDKLEKTYAPALVALLSTALNTKVQLAGEEQNQQRGRGPGGMGMPGMPGAGMPGMPGGGMPGMPGGRPQMPGSYGGGMPGMPGGGMPGMPGGRPQMPGSYGGGMPGMPGGRPGMPQMPGSYGGGRPGMPGGSGGFKGAMGGMPGMPGMPGQQPQEPMPQEEPPSSTVKLALQDNNRIVALTVSLHDPEANNAFMDSKIRYLVLHEKGLLDMAGGQFRIWELAQAAHTYPEAHGMVFPRGTADRQPPKTRAGRPYPPDQRVSWMLGLLPYLGPERASLYERVNVQKSWRDPENLAQAATLIPQFLDPHTPRSTWWVRYPGLEHEVATTQFVGIAGIGPDAAEYKEDDPAVAGKLGIFGYDRETRVADIKDGLSNTILMAEVPPTFKRPWLAGGGATVEGVPEKDSIKPFVSAEHNGKRGTYVTMADGSVRFITENVSDTVFKALCTINGGEAVDSTDLKRDAPVVPPPEK